MFKICPLREKNDVHADFSDVFMTQSILDSIDMKDTHIIYDHYRLKLNLEKALLMKRKVLQSYIKLMFNARDEKILNTLYDQAIIMCEDSNHSVIYE